ncbi:MAG: GNAT family N-acetyltransferase [Pseudozobellia sp.]|nr:GNAT family N-acetyltransferase [Pseudozobellia sp.]|tara:strand:- start:37632 stop:38183 length:552 start_codon:yes stop_codon:yes gene_type:complete
MIDFQKATLADAEAIAALHTLSWQQNYRGSFSDHFLDVEVTDERRGVWSQRLEYPKDNQSTWVARSNGKLAGFICTFLKDDQRYGSLVDNLHVSPEFKGKGIGTRLLGVAAEEIENLYPGSGFYLWVLEKNLGAHPFYKSLGGQVIETIKGNDIGDIEIMKVRYYWPKAKDLIALVNSREQST